MCHTSRRRVARALRSPLCCTLVPERSITSNAASLSKAWTPRWVVATVLASAERITLVMDNLNTHTPAALYEAFSPQKAKVLWDRFEFVYTPKHGSWLNMAEIELNVMIGQCLNRRIRDFSTLQHEVAAWQQQRDAIKATINWQFTTDLARVKCPNLNFIRHLMCDATLVPRRYECCRSCPVSSRHCVDGCESFTNSRGNTCRRALLAHSVSSH
jgi:DDE superfamily endonuclease